MKAQTLLATVLGVSLAVSVAPSRLLAAVIDCGVAGPGAIRAALDSNETFIEIDGTCVEPVDLFVINDGTAIVGMTGPATDRIQGNVFVVGAQRVFFDKLTVEGAFFVGDGGEVDVGGGFPPGPGVTTVLTGPGNVTATTGSNLQIRNSSIDGKGGNVAITNGAFAVIQNTLITDLGGGVFITNGAAALIEYTNSGDGRPTEITDTDNGIQMFRGATLRLNNATLGPARVDDGSVSCNPLCLGDNSHARIQNTTITGSTDDPGIAGALSLFRDASVTLRGDSRVENTGTEPAIAVFHDSSLRQDNSSGPRVDIDGGVLIFGMSYGDMRNARIEGDVVVDLHSVFRLRSTDGSIPSRINGDVTISRDSALDVAGPPTAIHGDVTCADEESSVSGSFAGGGNQTCSGF